LAALPDEVRARPRQRRGRKRETCWQPPQLPRGPWTGPRRGSRAARARAPVQQGARGGGVWGTNRSRFRVGFELGVRRRKNTAECEACWPPGREEGRGRQAPMRGVAAPPAVLQHGGRASRAVLAPRAWLRRVGGGLGGQGRRLSSHCGMLRCSALLCAGCRGTKGYSWLKIAVARVCTVGGTLRRRPRKQRAP
jgi:hypothetical protein